MCSSPRNEQTWTTSQLPRSKLGFRTVAIARGRDKGPLARQLGAHHYIDSASEDPAPALQALGGARIILATAANSEAMTKTIGGLARDGPLLVVGAAPEPIQVSPFQLIPGRRSVAGWPSGTAVDSEDTLKFSALTGVRPMIETYPLERAADAYERNSERQGPLPRRDRGRVVEATLR